MITEDDRRATISPAPFWIEQNARSFLMDSKISLTNGENTESLYPFVVMKAMHEIVIFVVAFSSDIRFISLITPRQHYDLISPNPFVCADYIDSETEIFTFRSVNIHRVV